MDLNEPSKNTATKVHSLPIAILYLWETQNCELNACQSCFSIELTGYVRPLN